MIRALGLFFVVSVLMGCAATDTLEVAPEDCAGIPNGSSVLDECGVCDGDGSSCADCAGVPNGDALLDECGVCEGDDSSCADCLGIPNGDAVVDACGVCDGDGSSCADCAGVPNGDALVDACGVCDGDGSSCADCAGVPNGDAVLDACGVCEGDDSSCADCLGVPNGAAVLDECGVCEGDGSSCADCAGVPNGSSILDACGVCDGDGSSCADCAGVSNGPAVFDECGVCDGDGSSCADCAGVPNGPAVLDECGVCDGDGSTCAPSVIITPEADALVNSYSPTTNYGLQEELRVDRGADESYLRFNLSAHIPAGATIESVAFKATAHTGFAWGNDGNVYTYLVEDDTWAEDGIHWNNRPSVTGESLGHWWLWYDYSDFTVRVGQHATAEMTAEVQTQLDLDGLLSVRLHSPGYRTNYRSREYADASMRPRLEVDYIDCAGIHSGDAFLDNCGDCVGGTTGLAPTTAPSRNPNQTLRLALAPAQPWGSRVIAVVRISVETAQLAMSQWVIKVRPEPGSIISGSSAVSFSPTAPWAQRQRRAPMARATVAMPGDLITVPMARSWWAQVRAGDHMDYLRGRCMSVSDVVAGSNAGYTSSAGGMGNSGGGSNYGDRICPAGYRDHWHDR